MRKFRNLIIALITSIPLLASCSLFKKDYTISLDASDVILEVDETKTLELNVFYKDNKITQKDYYSQAWTTSNENVVSVDQGGNVLALKEGTAIVIASVTITNVSFSGTLTATCKFTVVDNNEVKVSLNKDKANVQSGSTMQLFARIEHAKNDSVTWTSDSELITVDSKGVVSAPESTPIGSTANITATSVEDPNAKASCLVTVVNEPVKKYDYTIMFYMSGSNLEYDPNEHSNLCRSTSVFPGLFSEDIKEILSVDLPESVKVIIQTGGSKKWALDSSYIDGATEISSKKLQRWEVSNHKLKFIESYTNNRMADAQSFEDFLNWGISGYDAEQIGVVLSGHGAGLGGCVVDDNYTYIYEGYTYEHTLNTEEISTAVNNSLKTLSHEKLTWIGFDCCLMQSADMASVLADYFDYMVASQEEEIGDGWDHDVYMSTIVENPSVSPEVLLPQICSSFVKSCHDSYCETNDPCLQTLSVLNLMKMDAFTTAFNNYVNEAGYTASQYSKYRRAFCDAYNKFGGNYYGLVDFKDYMKKIATYIPSVSTVDVLSTLNDLVIANSYCSRYGSTVPCGLNAFFPYCPDYSYGLQVGKDDYNPNCTKFSKYQQMCYSNGAWGY